MKARNLMPWSCLLFASTAQAAGVDGFDAHGFHLSGFTDDPRAALQVERPVRFEQWDFFVGGLAEYASQPLVHVTETAEGLTYDPALDHVVALNLSAGLAMAKWLRVDVAAPVFFTSTGRDGVPNGPGFGDVRVAALVELVRPKASPSGGFGLGLVPYLDLPTGNPDVFLGQGAITGGGKAAITYEAGAVTIGADAGIQFQPETDASLLNLVGSDRVLLGGQLGYLFTPTLGANLEGKLYLPLEAPQEQLGTDTPAELALSVKHRARSGAFVLGGAAAAVSRGASAADFRLFLGGGFGNLKASRVLPIPTLPPPPPPPPTLTVRVLLDGQLVTGPTVAIAGGASPMEAKVAANPWKVEATPMRRYDAVATLGSCLRGNNWITAPETGNANISVDLVPVLDAKVTTEVVDARTGKSVTDAVITWKSTNDLCVPKDSSVAGATVTVGAGTHTATATATGYSVGTTSVSIMAGESKTIRISLERGALAQIPLKPVYFEVDKWALVKTPLADDFAVLDELVAVLKKRTDVELVSIQGHTDSDGSDAHNLRLSQHRAESVRDYLIAQGIASSRLIAVGYGERVPLDPNPGKTLVEQKAFNRRVMAVILQQSDDPPRTP